MVVELKVVVDWVIVEVIDVDVDVVVDEVAEVVAFKFKFRKMIQS